LDVRKVGYNEQRVYNTALSALNDAHYHGQITSKMFQDYLGQTPFPGKTIIQNVHYGQNMDQAFYNNGEVHYGDGDWIFYPMVALDVVAHEIAHGFTEGYGTASTKQLVSSQAGAINESFSDIAGAAAEYFLYSGDQQWSDDWLSNAESYRLGEALRYFANPTVDGVSIDHIKDYQTSTPPHYAAGIFNKAFHRLVTTQVAEGEVNPWNTKYGFILFANANQNCWVSTSTFTWAADCVFNQAATIAGLLSADGVTKADDSPWSTNELKNHIRKAFAQVGIDLAVNAGIESQFGYSSKFTDFNFSASSRSNGIDIDTSDSDNWQWLWNFGDGNTSTEAQPQHSYTDANDYVVSLQTTSVGTGLSDTFTLPVTATAGYCDISGGSISSYFIESVTLNSVKKDSGSSAYSDFSATSVPVINGSEFNIEIVSGKGTLSSGNNKRFYLWVDLNNDGLFDSTDELVFQGVAKDRVSGTIALSGQTDELLRARAVISFSILNEPCGSFSFGEAEDYTFKIGSNTVPPELIVNATPGTNQVSFSNTTIDSRIDSWGWNFGDGNTSNAVSPNHPYSASGTYNVVLNAFNQSGTLLASWQQPVTATTTTTPKITLATDGLSVTLNAATSVTPVGSTFSWDFDDNTPVGTSEQVVHTYAAAGNYNVTLTVINADNPQGKSTLKAITVIDSSYQAEFTTSVANNLDVTFNNNAAIPADLSTTATNATLTWDFGDGTPVQTATTADFGQNTFHSYANAGSYTATLTIEYTNDSGQLVTTNPASQYFTLTEPPVSVQYCTATGVTDYEFIGDVTFNGITWSNGNAGGLVNPGNPVEFTAGQNISYRIDTGLPPFESFYEENFHVWIDMDGDGVFGGVNDWQDDITERVITEYDGSAQGCISGNFTLPIEKFSIGTTHTRMRILQYYFSSPTTSLDPCAIYNANLYEGGEIEDYEVSITRN
jgi:vibriolysin